MDEIADAADVGRMTVFNHFPRKEDMFFDRNEEGMELLREALRERDHRVAPIEALRLLAHRLVSEQSRFVEFSATTQSFKETIEPSETLNRLRSWHAGWCARQWQRVGSVCLDSLALPDKWISARIMPRPGLGLAG
ncbi:AcrR family transcriptional regulator [Labrys monachus]|uniref:AcrR family transcriptional regulator n=1 Tax=Labrys monachus TaxID=217067 RepID=A0ABU0FGU9_9HYPH|nr:AcrR family transcriptional regulator [Labrys monachus]